MARTTVLQMTGKILFILLVLVLVTSLVTAQDLILNGNTTNNGTISVNRNVVNNTAGTVTVGGTGVVRLTGNGGATTHSIQGGTGISFYRLDMRGNRITTLNTATAVSDRLRVGYAANAYTAGTTGFSIGTQTLTLGNASTYDASSTAAMTMSGGTVIFNSGAAQSILNNASGITYGTLTLSSAGAKSVTTGGTVIAASLAQSGGQLSVTENIDVTGTGSFDNIGNISATKRLRLTNTATSGSVTAFSNMSTGTFENAANIAVPFTNNITNGGTLTTADGTLDFNGAGEQDNTGGTISVTGNGNVNFAGDIAAKPGTLTLNATSTATYDGAAQNLATGVTYGNLVADGTGAKTAAANLSVAGNLTLNQNILQTSGALTMTSTTASNVSGTGEVRGAVRRNHNFASGQTYRFNRSDVYLGTATTAGTNLTLNMTVNSDPGGILPSTKYVKRNYAVTTATAGNLEAIRLYYDVGELQGTIVDTKIGLRAYSGGTWAKVTNPGQTRSSGGANTYMTYSGLNNALPASGELGMFGVDFRSQANGANISLASGWDENALPTSSDDAIIAHTGVVTGNTAVDIATLTINSGNALSTDGTGVLTVATSTQVDGTLNITNANADVKALTTGSAGVVSVSSGRILSGTSFVNNSSNASTFAGNVSLSSLTNSGIGTLSFNGNSSSITDAISNVSGASISIGGTLNMMTSSALSFSSDGNITVNGATGILNIGKTGTASNLTMTGTSILTINNATGQLNVFGNLEIGATATLDNSGEINVGE